MTVRSKGWGQALGKVALVVGSVLATLAVLEVGLRVMDPAPPPRPAPAPAPGLRELHTVFDFATANVRGVMAGGVPYRTNSSGFRGPEYARPKPPGTFRIAVIGDSVTMGFGVAERDTYAARIERALNDPPGPVAYEVLDIGLAGLNATHVVERFEMVGLSYDPDLIIYGYTLNDIEGPAYRFARDGAHTQNMGNLAREEWTRSGLRVVTFFRTRLYSLLELIRPPEGSYVHELDDNYFHNPDALAAVDAAFDRLGAIARKRGVCVIVLHHTDLWFLRGIHPFRRHHAVVSRLVADHGFENKDTVDYFLGHNAVDLWVNAFDPHPNADGHAILARAALDALRALPAQCRAHP